MLHPDPDTDIEVTEEFFLQYGYVPVFRGVYIMDDRVSEVMFEHEVGTKEFNEAMLALAKEFAWDDGMDTFDVGKH